MWFKSANTYSVENLDYSSDELNELLLKNKFIPCGKADIRTAGWVSVFGDLNEMLVHSPDSSHFFCMKLEEKVIPASVVNEMVNNEIEKMKLNDPTLKIKASQRKAMKEAAYKSLIPTAHTKVTRIRAYIDTTLNLLIIDSSSVTQAENFIVMLLGTIADNKVKIRPMLSVHEPSKKMSYWLMTDQQPSGLDFGLKCNLIDIESLSTIRYAKHEMHDEKIKEYLKNSMSVSELEMFWDGGLKFTMTSDLMIKGVKFLESITDQVGEEVCETENESIDIVLRAIIGTMRVFIPYLLNTLGGQFLEQDDTQEPEASEAS